MGISWKRQCVRNNLIRFFFTVVPAYSRDSLAPVFPKVSLYYGHPARPTLVSFWKKYIMCIIAWPFFKAGLLSVEQCWNAPKIPLRVQNHFFPRLRWNDHIPYVQYGREYACFESKPSTHTQTFLLLPVKAYTPYSSVFLSRGVSKAKIVSHRLIVL